MGDGGAMFLGFLMATLALKLRLENASALAGWLAPLLVLGVAIFDTTLVTFSRSRRRLFPFASPGKDHIAHRLANLGLGQRGAVIGLYVVGAASGSAALLVNYLSKRGAALIAIAAAAVVLAGIVLLERAPFERQSREPRTLN
jgi:UDP-GlcNAc:undecaprenyl-phosphate GlcNAc-1-phosphate transferase